MKTSTIVTLLLLLPAVAGAQIWRSVGGGTSRYVECMWYDKATNVLYVGGDFETAGGVTVKGVGQWKE
jgi:hypothetical protein